MRPAINKVIYLLMLLTLVVGCKDKQASTTEVVKKPQDQTKTAEAKTKKAKKTILCFGDSLTAGHGLDEKDAWPTLLQQRLDSVGLDYTVVNAGLSGDTSAGGLNRIDWVLKQPIDLFFFELGANDMLRGLDVTKTRENLDNILQKVQAKHKDVPMLIAGMLAPPNMGKDYEQAFNGIFPSLAKKYNAKLIPFFLDQVAGVKELNNPDGLHPNEAGSKILLETVWKQLEGMLEG